MTIIKSFMLYVYCLSFRELSALLLDMTAVFLILYCTTRKRNWQRPVILAFSAIYILMIVCATLLWRAPSAGPKGISLIPFASYDKYAQGQTEMLRESIMNITLFYPLGLLLGGAASERFPRKKLLAFAFILSFFIEFCQWLFNLGYAEVDDVIHNTFGTGLGLLALHVTERTADLVDIKHIRPS